MLKAKGLRKVVVPSILMDHPSPGNIQPTRLALHVSPDGSSCWVFIASGSRVFKLQISMDESSVLEGKDSLLIPEQTKVLDSLLLDRCPHRSEIQSLVLAEVDSSSDQLLGTVDSYGHLIVSKLDAAGKGLLKGLFLLDLFAVYFFRRWSKTLIISLGLPVCSCYNQGAPPHPPFRGKRCFLAFWVCTVIWDFGGKGMIRCFVVERETTVRFEL
ncbi:uncharacterized protein E5676_scaffold1163G00970 [Cucumis melo var. makuwa]|uniref:Uncharacterized protein n=1 Tax=Cucumis melo var. makuwa TaxID=1194695 RepID=A0A5D3DGS2_CUCMM|nr:uncharacterized protein E5676_scaffold1163G00970 [Cucumis melo var. makuwa]